MRLIADLESRIATEESFFRRHLLTEDVVRLRKLEEFLDQGLSKETFLREGRHVGWTAGDFRTHEIDATLKPFLEAVFAGDSDATIEERFRALDADRLEKLVGCLSTRPRL